MARDVRESWRRDLHGLDVFIKDFELYRYDVNRHENFGRQTLVGMHSMGEFRMDAQKQTQSMEKLLLRLKPGKTNIIPMKAG